MWTINSSTVSAHGTFDKKSKRSATAHSASPTSTDPHTISARPVPTQQLSSEIESLKNENEELKKRLAAEDEDTETEQFDQQ